MRIVSVNIEGDRHLDTVLPFVVNEAPAALCLQEVFQSDLSLFPDYPHRAFLPTTKRQRFTSAESGVFGIGVLARSPFSQVTTQYLREYPEPLPGFDDSSVDSIYATYRYGIISVHLTEPVNLRIVTTHFTWTPDGMANDRQRQDLHALKAILHTLGEHVLIGDFNIPRGKNELYPLLAEGYTDCIRTEYDGSIDVARHRLKGTRYASELETNMVDYLFTTPSYRAHTVHLVDGVSDHKAIVADVSRFDDADAR